MRSDIKIIKDPKNIEMILDETRSKILALLRDGPLNANEITGGVSKSRSNVYRHIDKLREGGYIEEVPRSERDCYEKTFRRTANVFLLCPKGISSDSTGNNKIAPSLDWENILEMKKILEKLDGFGIRNDASDELAEKIAKLCLDINKLSSRKIINGCKKLENMTYPELLRMKLVLLLIEFQINDDIKDRIEDITSNFDLEGLES